MDSNNLTVVVFIENHYQEKLFLLNPVINSFQVLAVYSQIKPQYFTGKILETKAVSFEQALPQILDAISSEWIFNLKPWEKMPFINEILKNPYYFLKIKTIGESDGDSICFELRLINKKDLFSADFSLESQENNCLNVTVNNYSTSFPELDKLKSEKYFKLYENGDRRLSVILYLARKNYFDLEKLIPYPESGAPLGELYSIIENLTPEESKSGEALDLLCRIAEVLIEKKDFTEAKKILGKVLKDFDNSPAANYLLAEIYFETTRFSEAISFFNKCIEMEKNNSYYKFSSFPAGWISYQSYYRLGIIYEELGNLILAREAFENALENKHDFIEAKERLDFVENQLNKNYGESGELDFACQSCGNCCRQKSINVSHNDVKRILENRPDLQADDFITYKDIDAKSAKVSLFSGEFFTGEKGAKKWMLLKKKPESQDCIFLTENNLCGIHAFKPVVCKTWPFILRETDKNIVWAKNNREFIKQHCAHKLIKDSNNTEDLENSLNVFKSEREEYLQLIYKWNRAVENSDSKLNESDFLKFLFEKSADNLKEKKKNLLDNIIEVLKQDDRIKLVVDNPFASDYFPRIDDDLFLGLYIDDSSISKFFEPVNMDNLKIQFKAKSWFFSQLPVKIYNFYFENAFLILYIYPLNYLNEGIYGNSNILHNPLDTEIKIVSGEDIIQTEIKRLNDNFNYSFEEVIKLINAGDYQNSAELLRTMINEFLLPLVCWLNKREFSFLEIADFKNITADFKDFIIGLFDYISLKNVSDYENEKERQMAFAKQFSDIFERNRLLGVI